MATHSRSITAANGVVLLEWHSEDLKMYRRVHSSQMAHVVRRKAACALFSSILRMKMGAWVPPTVLPWWSVR